MSVNLMLRVQRYEVRDLGDGRQMFKLFATDPATGRHLELAAPGDLYVLCPEGMGTDWPREASVMTEFVPRALDGEARE